MVYYPPFCPTWTGSVDGRLDRSLVDALEDLESTVAPDGYTGSAACGAAQPVSTASAMARISNFMTHSWFNITRAHYFAAANSRSSRS